MIRRDNYFAIFGWMVTELNLKGVERDVFAIIFCFSQTEEQWYNGSWRYLSEFTGASRRAIANALASLIQKGLVEKKNTVINGVTFCGYRAKCTEIHTPCKICTGVVQNLHGGVQNLHGGSAKSARGGGAESAPNIIGRDNKEDSKENKKEMSPAADADGLVCVLKSRINKLFNRRDTTAWSPKETTRLKEISKRPGVLEELEEIEKLYNSGYQYRRRDIITFLNNFTTELDRSRSQAPKKYDPYDTYGGHFSMDYDKEVSSSIPRTVPGGPMNF